MEEADLLKERLQAITDKRRIQENIAIKRRQIEEEKLKLQYIKKKALREQWLMDGLSQQSEEEQEAMRLQAQDEQQQSDQLQSNILRIEKEIEDLETQELNISANEEVVLKRLKEVERTPEDIIKELNADFQTDLPHRVTSPLPHIAAFIPLTPAKSPPKQQPGTEEPKKATFAMEITVEHNKKTGKSQVVATANITPETFRDRGLKVYEDGRKSVYALHPHGGEMLNGGVREMTPTEVEELLDRAADKNVPSDVQYYQPVYSVTYTRGSRPSTPRTANKIVKPTPSPSPSQGGISSTSGAQPYRGEMDGLSTPSKTPESSLIEQDTMLRTKKEPKRLLHPHISGEFDSDGDQPHFGVADLHHGLTNIKAEVNGPSLVSVKARTDGIPTAAQLLYKAVDGSSPSPDSSCDFNRRSPFCAENTTTLSIVKSLPEEQQSEPVTMIFMGYEKAEDEEEEDFQAELVVIGSSSSDEDEEQAQHDINGSNVEECLSYHPEGYKSKVFQPKVGMAKITGCSNDIVDTYTDWDELGLHKPTFIHKGVKHNPYLQGHGVEERANTGDINMEKMKLCSTGR